jgi:D-alanyl-D-alanine dipeptidase
LLFWHSKDIQFVKLSSRSRRAVARPEDLYAPTPGHPTETIDNLDRIPIRENGEPLVDLSVACPEILVRPLSKQAKGLQARTSVAQRLNQAQVYLQKNYPGYRIMVVDGWRPPGEQARWHQIAKTVWRLRHPFWPRALIREAANKYVAAPDAIAPPPHSTGGAIDVRLCKVEGNGTEDSRAEGKPLKMGPWNPASCRTEYPHLSAEEQQRRRMLCDALEHAGFSNYEEEWWHWSYGDSGWALRTNQEWAFYGKITPGKVTPNA